MEIGVPIAFQTVIRYARWSKNARRMADELASRRVPGDLEPRWRWLLRAYPAWYRRERSEELLNNLLANYSLSRTRPRFREARKIIIGGLRVRGWTWALSMLWVLIGAGGAIYAAVALSHPDFQEVLIAPPTVQWNGEPQLFIDAAPIAELTWALLSALIFFGGLFRLRGWRPRNWPRMIAFAGSLVGGAALMIVAKIGLASGLGEHVVNQALRLREMVLVIAWVALGGAINWALSVRPASNI